MPKFLPIKTDDTRAGTTTASVSGPVYNPIEADWWSEAESQLFSQWASTFSAYKDSFNNPYFDYFFTGQDVQITIDGLDSAEDLLPFYSFAYNIQQQKQPIYGFASYTYDAVLRGTRIITGAFSIVSTSPYLLTQQIAKAADVRANSTQAQRIKNMYSIKGLDEDESLINQYWRRTFDSNLDPGQQHLFSIHPPFNFVLRYGIQQTSTIHESPNYRANEIKNKFAELDPWYNDTNERLVQNPIADLDAKILLENVELMSKQIEFDVEGNPLLETYTFMARDEILLHPVETSQLSPYVPDTSPTTPSSSGNNPLRPVRGAW